TSEHISPQLCYTLIGWRPGLSGCNLRLNMRGYFLDNNQEKFLEMPTGPTFSDGYQAKDRTTFWFHSDHLGSASYISNEHGTVSQHMEYLPFGELLVDEHLNSINLPFKFNGKMLDSETGNYYYGARYYDPKLSIFLSVDPLAEQTFD